MTSVVQDNSSDWFDNLLKAVTVGYTINQQETTKQIQAENQPGSVPLNYNPYAQGGYPGGVYQPLAQNNPGTGAYYPGQPTQVAPTQDSGLMPILLAGAAYYFAG